MIDLNSKQQLYAEWLKRSIWLNRGLIALGMALFPAYSVLDWLLRPEALGDTLPLRWGITVFYAALLAFSFHPRYPRWFYLSNSALGVLTVLTVVHIFNGVLRAHESAIAAQMLLVICLMGFTVHRAFFWTILASVVVVPNLYALFTPIPSNMLALTNFVLGSTALTALVSGEIMRRQFIYSLQLENQLEHEAGTDLLSGVHNRRSFMSMADREWARAQRQQLPLSVLMIDIDHFKQINDQFGHAAGDAVISHIGALLQQQSRGNDIAGRLGGEEFALLLPDQDLEGAIIVAERLRHRIEQDCCQLEHKALPCTVSIGIATRRQQTHFEMLLRDADHALYSAKEAGRNCLRSHGMSLQ